MVESLIFLAVLSTISCGLLFYFYRATSRCDRYISAEGLQQIESPGNKWGLMIVMFLLTVLHLPLCTMSVHVPVWSQEVWPIADPYVNATSLTPVLPPGPGYRVSRPVGVLLDDYYEKKGDQFCSNFCSVLRHRLRSCKCSSGFHLQALY